jgi:tetratricopeptide (TPR) repeat protein
MSAAVPITAEARRSRFRLARAAWWLWGTLGVAVLAAAAWFWARPDPDRLLSQAQAEVRAGRYPSAEALLARLARLREPTPFDRLVRAQVAGGLGRLGAAVAELSQIPDQHPAGALARLSEGQFEARRGRLVPAEAAFRAALALEPRCVQARRELVFIYSIQNRLPELDAQLAALAEQKELDFQHLLHWGMVHHAPWAADQDRAALERFVAADPGDRYSRLALVEALRRTGQRAQAAALLEPLPASDPAARAARAQLALDDGDHAAVEALLSEGPSDHPALALLRGQLALSHGDPHAAIGHFRVALAAWPEDRAARFGLATALNLTGDTAAAQPLFEAIRRHDALGALLLRASSKEGPNDPTLPRRLGLACIAAGRPREARAWLELAIARDPLDGEAQRALYRLAGAGMISPDRGG